MLGHAPSALDSSRTSPHVGGCRTGVTEESVGGRVNMLGKSRNAFDEKSHPSFIKDKVGYRIYTCISHKTNVDASSSQFYPSQLII